jgi:hypothetical protein
MPEQLLNAGTNHECRKNSIAPGFSPEIIDETTNYRALAHQIIMILYQ